MVCSPRLFVSTFVMRKQQFSGTSRIGCAVARPAHLNHVKNMTPEKKNTLAN